MTPSTAPAEWLPDLTAQVAPPTQVARVASGLPEIRVNGRELRDVSAEALEAVNSANDPVKLFARAGAVVRVDHAEDGRPMIVPVADVHFRGEMTRAADFYKVSKRGADFIRTAVSPPMDAARDILSRPVAELGFPALEAIAEAPFIRPDGVIVAQEGYDPQTRTFYAPVGDLKEFHVPDRPTADDVDGARTLIEDAIGEFPFEDEASRANAFALFITPEIRHAILGNIPMALVDAPQAGSGKTLLVSIVSEKTSGSAAAMKPAPIRDDDEWRKTLTATIQAGQCLTIFDNVDHVLSSPSLALALTASTWTDRILGSTEIVTLPQRTVFVGTGNNITLGGDLPRRCYRIRLNAQCSEPWRNRQFRHPDLRGWVRTSRGRLLSACLTLARAWFIAGCPPPASPIVGSFEEWCRIAGGILEFAGVSASSEIWTNCTSRLTRQPRRGRHSLLSCFGVCRNQGSKERRLRRGFGMTTTSGRHCRRISGILIRPRASSGGWAKLSLSASGVATGRRECTSLKWARARVQSSGPFARTRRTSREFGDFRDFVSPPTRGKQSEEK